MTDAYLLDTNVICALADTNHKSHAAAFARFQQVGQQFVLVPTMAVAEIEFGMERAVNVKPEKREELRKFVRQFEQIPFDNGCVKPYAVVRAELWRTFSTPKGRSSRERHPEDLCEKTTGTELGIDEPDLIIASVAMAQNLVLVTDDRMKRVRESAEKVFRDKRFSVQLRTENWTGVSS
ncbi:MAG: type II toxin-antitoxin system VapC family toxin [Verrucomicrobia bacterium]|nr:type II toxin-antitoxin system VapC family toxin [Verrucomicrobiota bacterium]